MHWLTILEKIKTTSNDVQIDLCHKQNLSLLKEIAVDENSTLGQLLTHVKKLRINRYLRVLASDILDVNNDIRSVYPGNKLVVATDFWGGIFAINNGDFEGDETVIWYYAPDTLEWESLDIDYDHFVPWILCADFAQFHSSFVWDTFEETAQQMTDDDAILVYPFLWANECDIQSATKKIVPYIELVRLNAQYQSSFMQ